MLVTIVICRGTALRKDERLVLGLEVLNLTEIPGSPTIEAFCHSLLPPS